MKRPTLKKQKTIITIFIAIIFLLIVIPLIIEGFFSSKNYLKPWDKEYSENFSDPRVKIISNGILAPNGHNLQNCKFVLSKEDVNSFDLYIESSRLAKEVDPLLTQTIISHGALFSYLNEASKHFGYKLNITLFPDGEIYKLADISELNSKRVAKITLTKDISISDNLYNNIFKPDTSRLAYKKEEISENIMRELNSLNDSEAISISYIGPNSSKYEKLQNYIIESVKIKTSIDRIMDETHSLFRINEKEKNKYRYGFSFEGSSMGMIEKHFKQSLLSIFPSLNSKKNSIKEYMEQTKVAVENNAGFILIKTSSDTLKNEFDVGNLYGNIVLKAHDYKLSVQPISAPIEEYEEMRELNKNFHSDFANDNEKVLMLFRIGQPEGRTSQTMRIDALNLIK